MRTGNLAFLPISHIPLPRSNTTLSYTTCILASPFIMAPHPNEEMICFALRTPLRYMHLPPTPLKRDRGVNQKLTSLEVAVFEI